MFEAMCFRILVLKFSCSTSISGQKAFCALVVIGYLSQQYIQASPLVKRSAKSTEGSFYKKRAKLSLRHPFLRHFAPSRTSGPPGTNRWSSQACAQILLLLASVARAGQSSLR